MFEAAKVGRGVNKADFRAQVPELRTELLAAQRDLKTSDTPVVVIVSGVEAAGKGEVVNRLNEWLDTRGLQTHAYWGESDEERERPRYWRFWRTMPPRGEVAIMFGSWYMSPLNDRVRNRISDAELDDELKRIAAFERMLTEDGALVVKFWFHLPEKEQRKRLKQLKRNDRSRWRMAPKLSNLSEHYQYFERVAERLIRLTDMGIAPWYQIEATDRRYRDLTVGRTLLESIRTRLNSPSPVCVDEISHAPSVPVSEQAQITVLDRVDLSRKLDRETYKSELKQLQAELNGLTWKAYAQGRSSVLVFEGVDAGGKGGAIRRITHGIDARLYRTIPVAAPTDEEKAQHYLWRFWRQIPRAGRVTIYDRSWYGRVLVERVEGFASDEEWRRAYAEINDFEEQLVESGVVLLKFWLHIDQEEQLHRFKQREQTSYKKHKITDEDWRNRDRWGDYKTAVNEMVIRTSTEYAPWTLIPGNDKLYARINVLETVCDRLRSALAGKES